MKREANAMQKWQQKDLWSYKVYGLDLTKHFPDEFMSSITDFG